jgi:CDP-diacylglycerol---glycerol-3-phosphate 3-phosphatidyltransferase
VDAHWGRVTRHLTIPNQLTILRILMVPVIGAVLAINFTNHYQIAAAIYVAAAATDTLDGRIARSRNLVTELGKFLDPLADKLLVMASLVYMVPMGRIPEWAVVLLLAREISVTSLRSIASSEGVVIAAGDDGKSKTALQMVGILALILGYPYHLSLGPLDLGIVDLVYVGRALVYISLVFSILSAVSYLRLFAAAVEAKDRRRE